MASNAVTHLHELAANERESSVESLKSYHAASASSQIKKSTDRDSCNVKCKNCKDVVGISHLVTASSDMLLQISVLTLTHNVSQTHKN